MYAEAINELMDVVDDKESYEERRQRALQVIYDLKFIFNMEELAREFLHSYVSRTDMPPPRLGRPPQVITERVLHRV